MSAEEYLTEYAEDFESVSFLADLILGPVTFNGQATPDEIRIAIQGAMQDD